MSSHTAYSCINRVKKNEQNTLCCTSAETRHSVIACVEAQATRGKGTPCVHDAGDVTHVGCSASSPLRKGCVTSEKKKMLPEDASLSCKKCTCFC